MGCSVVCPRPSSLELRSQFDELCFSLSSDWTAEVQEDLESGGTRLIEELETARCSTVHMTGLFDREHCGQLLPSDVHIERISLHVEEFARRAEAADLPVNFDRRCAIRTSL